MANVIYELNIDIVSQKSPAIHYDGQHHDYAFWGYTYYYSRTRMLGTGSIRVNGGRDLAINADV